jgi:hypothetical protein
MILRRIFGPKREEITGRWRKLLDEVLHNLYSSSNIIRVIKSRRMRWVGHKSYMRDKECMYSFSQRTLDNLRDLDIGGRIVLKFVLNE